MAFKYYAEDELATFQLFKSEPFGGWCRGGGERNAEWVAGAGRRYKPCGWPLREWQCHRRPTTLVCVCVCPVESGIRWFGVGAPRRQPCQLGSGDGVLLVLTRYPYQKTTELSILR